MSKTYKDYQGNVLPEHDGTVIEIENVGFQYFDINGQGFIHDGTTINMPDGRKQFFMGDGKAFIHDGSPIELSNGLMQYFDHDGLAMWPIDERRLTPLFTKQREVFFEDRIEHINKQTPLSKNEIEDIRLALLAGEHPDYISRPQGFQRTIEMSYLTLEPINSETSSYLHLLKMTWCSVWREYQLRHREKLSARFVLEQHKKDNCILACNTLSESVLASELERELKRADQVIKRPDSVNEIEQLGLNKAGLFILDDALIKYAKQFSSSGKGTQQLVADINSIDCKEPEKLQSRVRLWQQALYGYRCIANIVWLDRVKGRVESLQKKPPALTYVVHEQAHKPMRKGTVYDKESGKIVDYKGQELAIIEDIKNIPSMDVETIQNILSPTNIKVLSTVNAHRLLRWEVQTVTRQFVENSPDARALKVIGGYQELAQQIGVGNSKKAAEQLRDIIVWQAAPRFYGPDGRCGNMLSFDYVPSGHNRKAVLSLIMGNMMLPHYVFELLGMSKSNREGRRLIPIVDMPPLIGRPNDQGAQASFQMEVLVEMRKGAVELVNNGGVTITKERLRELAERAGLSYKLYQKVIDRWIQDGTDAPAFLKLLGPDCYALGENYKKAQDFMIQAGKKEIRGAKAGKMSRAKKNKSIF